MKKNLIAVFFCLLLVDSVALSQKSIPGIDRISASDIESHMTFLASPLLGGRINGEPGLNIAQGYIVSQVSLLGLKPGNGASFYQPYLINNNTIDKEKSFIRITSDKGDTSIIRKTIFQVMPQGPTEYSVSGEVIFAGYGLKQDIYGYNDFAGIKADGKILLIMSGAPTSADGMKYLFDGVDWGSFAGVDAKLLPLMFSRAKAVIIVMDPKCGLKSFADKFPGISGEFANSRSLKGDKPATINIPNMPRILFADRSVADEILKGTGHSLEELQQRIDSSLKPFSFVIPEKKVEISESVKPGELTLYNVAAVIEGSDPVLKNEFVIFSGHSDHTGGPSSAVNSGADDNASGCSALLSLARAFQNLEKKPLRSILFLWVSGEEIGLFGSASYLKNPLIPIENTVCDINMDMIGRIKRVADTTTDTPMTGKDEVFVITDYQSSDLVSIAKKIDDENILNFDYSLSARNHPLQLFRRSDHYNFAVKGIPVLFFTTGLHTDYHTPGDVLEKIDFPKMEAITRAMYQIGYTVANRKTRISVDNPMKK